ncbi:MAG: aldo/keto reductase [Bacilli bacterium]|jgi:predicted aldo/keto reductase-like oxidoreductase|nr:aldo/keto reductase [Bacilli bacterium]
MDTDVQKLGFGLMRLPKLSDGKTIDVEETKRMVDLFLKRGFKYFDTAYVYDNGGSEKAIKTALVDRYPRSSYFLTTKLCAWTGCHDEVSAKQEFYTSLERTGAGYFDYYLLHALQSNNYTKYDEYHLWDFVKELKAKGLIRHYGFSFHADPALLDKLLTLHPDVDFVQLQLNYADWEDQGIQSRANYEVARKHNKPVIVMEPVKGGLLVNLPTQASTLLKTAEPDMSIPSWAIRYVASLPGVFMVLSGMSNLTQMENNTSYMEHFKPLDAKEEALIKKVQTLLKEDKIPCTACHYCCAGCPKQIPIPEIFALRNKVYEGCYLEDVISEYRKITKGKGKASDCIKCGQCERACPQHIHIREKLAEASKILEK